MPIKGCCVLISVYDVISILDGNASGIAANGGCLILLDIKDIKRGLTVDGILYYIVLRSAINYKVRSGGYEYGIIPYFIKVYGDGRYLNAYSIGSNASRNTAYGVRNDCVVFTALCDVAYGVGLCGGHENGRGAAARNEVPLVAYTLCKAGGDLCA